MLGSCGKKRRLGREVCASWGRPPANSEDRSKSPFLKITMLTTWREDGQGREPRGRKTREGGTCFHNSKQLVREDLRHCW